MAHHDHDHDQMDEDEYDRPTVAVAIDRDKNSQAAVKWAVDNLLMRNQCVSLVHVRIRSLHNQMEGNSEESEALMQQFFLPFRGYCARKAIITKEVVLDDTDIVNALISYINANCITSFVLGAPNRNTFTRKFMKPTDVPSSVTKSAPDFCGVYAISKTRVTTVRSANRPAPIHGAPPRQPAILRASDPSGQEDGNKQMGGHVIQTLVFTPRSPRKKGTGSRLQVLLRLVDCGVWRSRTPLINKGNGSHRGGSLERRYLERSNENMKMPPRERPRTPVKGAHTPDNNDFSVRSRNPGHRDSLLDEDELSVVPFSRSCDLSIEDVGFSFTSEDTSSFMSSQASRDIEAEMRRLKLELKQTMDMYSSACKEALTAKQKALELQKWKMDESRKFEQAKLAEEAALALAKFEKERCIRALESAGMSQKLAEIEAQKRMEVELKLIRESEQRRAFGYTNNDVRYRKYSVEEIEIATDNFSEELKIGEGGYGPVYRTTMDHTPVAIKAMRADTAQGMEQFQKEVEVLSCIRHPNMVLLLGACPDNGCLVYEYMDNGSLDDRLFRRGDTPPIPWSIRFKIAAEIATALLFLHQTKPEPLVHRDLKPGNILLDRNYTSKISDVGLARLVPPTVADTVTQYRMTSAAGTFCYIDPEYQQTGMLGIKSDVYSLGIMLLQMITARPPMGLTHHVERSIEKGTFGQMLDPAVTDWPVQEAMSFAKLALQCSELRRKDRPDLCNVVLPELNRLRQLGMSETNLSSPISYAPWSYNAYSRPRSSHASQETSYSHTSGPPHRSSYEGFSARSSPKILIGRERFVPTRLRDANE